MKLKVLNIAELYPPGYAGGAAIYVHDTCKFLAEKGHDIRVLCTESNETPAYTVRKEVIEGVTIYRLNLPYFRDEDPGGWMMNIDAWKKHCAETMGVVEEIFADWQPDLVKFHTPYSLVEESLPAILERNIPVIGMAHDFWTICTRLGLSRSPTDSLCTGPGVVKCVECMYSHWDGSHAKALAKFPWRLAKLGFYPAYRLWSRLNLRNHTEGLVCYSKCMTEAHRGHIDGLVEHISLGIDLTKLQPPFEARPHDPVRFGFAAGFIDYKGIWDILDTVASLKRKGYKFELHIWGPKQAEGPLIERGIEDFVKLRGLYTPEEIWDVYAEMDVHLMTSRLNEAYGRVIQEAAAAKVPSIAARAGGIVEQIRDGVDGLLYNYRDREDLERQMIKIIEQPELLTKLRENLWQVINTRDAVDNLERFYIEILDRKKSAAVNS
jgi:glycosyltransferase involved in cell wall biosynthesis